MQHLTDSAVDAAFNSLVEIEGKAAEARGRRVYLEEYRRSLLALLRKEAPDKSPQAEKDAFAHGHEKYVWFLNDLRDAVIEDERYRAMQSRLKIQCEAWRTASANRRITP